MMVREFLKWSGWTKTEYDEAPFDEVEAWWQTWLAEVQHRQLTMPS